MVEGKYYPAYSEIEGLLQDYGCLHFAFPIILGVSEPTWGERELNSLKENDKRKFVFEGKEYTGYEAKQVQRTLETNMRKQRDRYNIAKASGDVDLRLISFHKGNQISQKYKQFSDAAGLPTYAERTRVVKPGRVVKEAKVKTNVAKSGKSGIIKERKDVMPFALSMQQ